MKWRGLASPRSLTIRQIRRRREPRDFGQTNPISRAGAGRRIARFWPNEPNLRAQGPTTNRAILAKRTQSPGPRLNDEPRDSGQTNPISAPRLSDESRDFGRTKPISALRPNSANAHRDWLWLQSQSPGRPAERTQIPGRSRDGDPVSAPGCRANRGIW